MLIYIGMGAWCPPYPARDLTDDEVKEFGEDELIKTGLYQKASIGDLPKADKTASNKNVGITQESE